MTKYVYCNILETKLMSTIQMQDLEEDQVIFQHDNGPNDIAHHLVNWLFAQNFSLLNTLTSNDDNQLEHLQYEVDKCEGMRGNPLAKVTLWKKIQEIWYNVEVDNFRK